MSDDVLFAACPSSATRVPALERQQYLPLHSSLCLGRRWQKIVRTYLLRKNGWLDKAECRVTDERDRCGSLCPRLTPPRLPSALSRRPGARCGRRAGFCYSSTTGFFVALTSPFLQFSDLSLNCLFAASLMSECKA